jgi:hypothetical protein
MSLIKSLKAIIFPVRKIALKDLKLDFVYNQDLDHAIVVDLKEGPKIVNFCSKNYTLIKNEDLFIPLAKKLEEKYKGVTAVVKHYRDSKFYVDFIIKEFAMKILKKGDDVIVPRLRGANSYDGSLTYRFSFGFYRPFCENMINANTEVIELDDDEEVDFENLVMRHTLSASEAVSQTLAGLESFLEFAPKMKQVYKQLITKEYTHAQALERLELIARQSKYPPNSKEYALLQLDKERKQFPITDYILYNSLNSGLYNNPKSKMKDHKKDKVDLRVLDYLLHH